MATVAATPAAATTKVKKPKKVSAPRNPPQHPPYFEMITDAIVSLKERSGSSSQAISKFIENKYKSLPANYKKLLSVQLKKNVADGKLVKVKASFKLAPKNTAVSAGSAKPVKKAAVKKAVVKKKVVATPTKAKAAAKPKAKAPAAKGKTAAKVKVAVVTKAKPAAKVKAAAKAKPAAKPATKAAKTSTRSTPGRAAAATKTAAKKTPVKKAASKKTAAPKKAAAGSKKGKK